MEPHPNFNIDHRHVMFDTVHVKDGDMLQVPDSFVVHNVVNAAHVGGHVVTFSVSALYQHEVYVMRGWST